MSSFQDKTVQKQNLILRLNHGYSVIKIWNKKGFVNVLSFLFFHTLIVIFCRKNNRGFLIFLHNLQLYLEKRMWILEVFLTLLKVFESFTKKAEPIAFSVILRLGLNGSMLWRILLLLLLLLFVLLLPSLFLLLKLLLLLLLFWMLVFSSGRYYTDSKHMSKPYLIEKVLCCLSPYQLSNTHPKNHHCPQQNCFLQ